MRSSDEAVAYARALHALVVWLGITEGNMQNGNFRCDANVSVRPKGEEKLGTRCEIKNLNSFRFLQAAIDYEVERQIELIEDGGTVVQQTRLYDPDKNETRPMRSKEDSMDYRYFPDPDLLPCQLRKSPVSRRISPSCLSRCSSVSRRKTAFPNTMPVFSRRAAASRSTTTPSRTR